LHGKRTFKLIVSREVSDQAEEHSGIFQAMERCSGKEKNWFTNCSATVHHHHYPPTFQHPIIPQVYNGPHCIESNRLKAKPIKKGHIK
jgi:hypothetical protein